MMDGVMAKMGYVEIERLTQDRIMQRIATTRPAILVDYY